MKVIRYLIEKEFKQIVRNSFMPKLILGFPIIALLILPLAANFEIKNINLSLVDNDHSSYSNQLVQKILSSGYFKLTDLSSGYRGSLRNIEDDKADIILEIPVDFQKSLVREQRATIFIAANTVNGTKGSLGSSYLSGIVSYFASEIRSRWIQTSYPPNVPIIEINTQNWFNPVLSYKFFMVPALMVMLLTMICGFLPALNIVGEKEAGTMEQINVTPVHKFTFIMSKLLPYWIVGFLVISIGFGIAYLAYGLAPAGKLSTVYLFAAIYILGISGLGLVISNYSGTMQQAMFVMYFFMLILILMSGLFTPVSSMPVWAQFIAAFNPIKYFMKVMRLIYLKGSAFVDLKDEFLALTGFAFAFNGWAILSYKKRV